LWSNGKNNRCSKNGQCFNRHRFQSFVKQKMAVGALKAIKQKGLSVAKDISVIGFDDIPLCELIETELTTIVQPQYDMGVQAMQMLLSIINKRNLTRKQIVLPHRLKVRKMCGTYNPLSF
jgi:LacI family repressor for deo operon, udp, cdd, tsx, nupC, and nupG